MKTNNSFKDFFHCLYKKQDGAVAVIAAAAMISLIGITAFAFDLGRAYVETSKLQNALDSAALAAVNELPANSMADPKWNDPNNGVVAVAKEYALINGYEDVIVEPLPDNYEVTGSKIIGVRVKAENYEVPYRFAGIFGTDSGFITRSAEARKQLYGLSGLIPVGITEEYTVSPGAIVELRFRKDNNGKGNGNEDEEEDYSGWFGAIQLDGEQGGGAQEYEEDFIYGSSVLVSVGDILIPKNGVMNTGTTVESYNIRVAGHEECTFEEHEPDCPRLVMVPIIQIIENKNQIKFRVAGFASMFLENCTQKNNGNKGNESAVITARFVKIIDSADANIEGLYVPRLTN